MVAIDLNIIFVVVLIAFFFVFLLKKISFKIMLIIGLIILGISAGFLLIGQKVQANTIATFAFGVFIVAVVLATIEYLRDLTWEDLVITCPSCRTEVQPGFKFCPECGKQLTIPKKTIDRDKENLIKKKKFRTKLSSLKLIKISKKIMIAIIAIICIIIIVVAATFYINYGGTQNTNINTGGGRTFTITITNNFTSNASCYLLIDNLKQGTYNNMGFIINANNTTIISINEDNLISKNNSHSIKLIVTIGMVEESDVAAAVTKSATFLIDNVEGEFDAFYVNCTTYL